MELTNIIHLELGKEWIKSNLDRKLINTVKRTYVISKNTVLSYIWGIEIHF